MFCILLSLCGEYQVHALSKKKTRARYTQTTKFESDGKNKKTKLN